VIAREPAEATLILPEASTATLERSPTTALRVLRTLVRHLLDTHRRLQAEAASLPLDGPPRVGAHGRQR
jgi:hypothetical protein